MDAFSIPTLAPQPGERGSQRAASPEKSSTSLDGRVLEARVLARQPGGATLLEIEGRRVSVDSQLVFKPGERLLLRAVASPSELLFVLIESADQAQGAQPLTEVLRARLGHERPLGELLETLEQALVRILARPAGAEAKSAEARLRELLGSLRLLAHDPRQAPQGSALRARLAELGLDLEQGLARAAEVLGERSGLLNRLRSTLKARLLALVAQQPKGEARSALEAAVSGLEAEQALELARQEGQESRYFSLPLHDGRGWNTAHVYWRSGSRSDGQPDQPEESWAELSLGVEFSQTGKVRADLRLEPGLLRVRLRLASEELVQRVRADLELLQARLERPERRLHLLVGLGSAAELQLDAPAMDLACLRGQALLEVDG